MSQASTSEVVVELFSDESRQPGAVFGYVVQESRQVRFDDRIERSFFGLVSTVADEAGRLIQLGWRIDRKHDDHIS